MRLLSTYSGSLSASYTSNAFTYNPPINEAISNHSRSHLGQLESMAMALENEIKQQCRLLVKSF
jgi:hypothetical protein